jgi:hypothetical protein
MKRRKSKGTIKNYWKKQDNNYKTFPTEKKEMK